MSTQIVKNNALLVRALEIDEKGELNKKVMALDRDSQLENTLLEALYPGIQVATVDVPRQQLDTFEQARVEQTLTKLAYDGVKYRLIGASASAKLGKYYAVDVAHERPIAERFRNWPEAAMVYFGILVSPCNKGRLELPKARLMVVEDHELGTNDCRGWTRHSMFQKLQQQRYVELVRMEKAALLAKRKEPNNLTPEQLTALVEQAERNARGKVLPDGRFYQFRLAFATTQAKGSFKVMDDDVADALSVDIILPKSSVKPEYKGPSVLRQVLSGLQGVDTRVFEGPVVFGIRDMSRLLEFKSSYTLTQHAPMDSIETEIIPFALEQVRKITEAAQNNDFEELFRLLGTSESQRAVEDTFEDGSEDSESDYTSVENTILEAVLKADPTGYFVRHPHVNKHLQRRLAKWAYKVSTAGGFTLPAFALADDGVLFLHEGKVWSASDWVPQEHAIAPLACERFLLVRYPIRTKEDLLPIHNLHTSDAVARLTAHLQSQGCPLTEREALDRIVAAQLTLEGVLILHSQTAKKNGGDYDFDLVSSIDETRFPRFVEDRFSHRGGETNQKNKLSKKQSPWWNLPQVAMKAKGNSIGRITDLITSCLAEAREDLADRLALELQAALDSLKHGIEPDEEILREIRKQVNHAPWLKCKRAQRVQELPLTVQVAQTDRIGALYNIVRKELDEFFTDVLPLEAFRGVISADCVVTREMHNEASQVYRIYWKNLQRMSEIRAGYAEASAAAEKAVEEAPKDAANRKQLFAERAKAQAALHFYEDRQHKELKALISFVRKWAERKTDNRLGWLQALYEIVCRGKGQGSIVFYAFPQEVVDQIVERTGGRPITVAIPEMVDGEVEIDKEGRVFLVDRVPEPGGESTERHVFLMQVTNDGRILMDYGQNGKPVERERIRPFAVQPGRSEARNGRIVFPETQQRPYVPLAKSYRQ
jgi:hypothetical protein